MNISATMMNFSALVLLLGLTGTVYSSPVCPVNCKIAEQYSHQYFRHMSDLSRSSAAPWNLNNISQTEGGESQSFQYAVCQDCTVEHMVAKPIYLEISVFQRVRNGTGSLWCRCPYNLAVGCTCVKEQQQ